MRCKEKSREWKESRQIDEKSREWKESRKMRREVNGREADR